MKIIPILSCLIYISLFFIPKLSEAQTTSIDKSNRCSSIKSRKDILSKYLKQLDKLERQQAIYVTAKDIQKKIDFNIVNPSSVESIFNAKEKEVISLAKAINSLGSDLSGKQGGELEMVEIEQENDRNDILGPRLLNTISTPSVKTIEGLSTAEIIFCLYLVKKIHNSPKNLSYLQRLKKQFGINKTIEKSAAKQKIILNIFFIAGVSTLLSSIYKDYDLHQTIYRIKKRIKGLEKLSDMGMQIDTMKIQIQQFKDMLGYDIEQCK